MLTNFNRAYTRLVIGKLYIDGGNLVNLRNKEILRIEANRTEYAHNLRMT